jgi:hypothetical protein
VRRDRLHHAGAASRALERALVRGSPKPFLRAGVPFRSLSLEDESNDKKQRPQELAVDRINGRIENGRVINHRDSFIGQIDQ